MKHLQQARLNTALKLLPLAFAAALVGCGSVKLAPFSADEVKTRAADDRVKMYVDQEVIVKPLTFEDTAARALKYNLDYRLKLAEQALAGDMLDVSQYDMLPRLLVGAGWNTRSNDSGGTSVGINSGIQTLSPSTSNERSHSSASAALSWSVLDFGISYYRAQQRADGVLMADERRRKVIQNIMQDVRNSYWRALGAQRMLPRVDALLAKSQTALARSRQIEEQKLLPQPTVLAYQRSLIDAVFLLQQRRQDLELARAELMALMNIAPGTAFTLADTAQVALPPVPTNISELERIAMEMRPELNEEAYRKRVTLNDLRVAQLALFPNLSANVGWQADSNKFLYNSSWIDSGLNLSWNLMKLPQWPALKKAIGNQASVDDLRRYAQGMAVLTQVRIGTQRYGLARMEFEIADQSFKVDERLLNYSRSAVKTNAEGELELIRSEARALLTEYQRHSAYSQAQAAWGRVYNSIGLDVLPKTLDNTTVDGLSQSIKSTMSEWERVTFRSASPRANALPEVKLVGVGVVAEEVTQAATKALGRNGIVANGTTQSAWTLEMAWSQTGDVGSGMGTVNMRLVNPVGQVVHERAQEVALGERTPAVVRAAVESAVDSNAKTLLAAFKPPQQN
jgi:outer membrane protein TolC